MRILLQAAILATSLLSPQVAAAQTAAPSDCLKLADVRARFLEQKTSFVELSAKSLLNVDAPDLGSIVVFALNGTVEIAFEVKGCMAGPLPLALIKVPVSS